MTQDSEKPANASHPADDLLDPDSTQFWREADLAAICQHQLSAPVEVELGSLGPSVAAKLPTLCSARGLLLRSFGDLLAHPHPPLDLLQIVRRFAKTMLTHPRSPLPPQVAAAFYYASIFAAMLRCDVRISNLDDAELRQGIQTCLSYAWLAVSLRSLLSEGLASIDGSEGRTP